jgi:hypothetical protein
MSLFYTEVNMESQIGHPSAVLEKALMEEYLRAQGYSLEKLNGLPKEIAERLRKEASQYASLKMEEVEARARFVEEIHDAVSSSE